MMDQSTNHDRVPLAARIGEWATDIAALAGAASATYGVEQIFRPAGFIVAGGFLLIGAWLAARGSAN